MIKGLIVSRDEGTLVYSYLTEYVSENYQTLISGFLASLQLFAKSMFDANTAMRSMREGSTIYTFKKIVIHGPAREPFGYIFVLMSESNDENSAELEEILEFLIVSFLGFENGQFISRLRIEDCSTQSGFDVFNSFMVKFLEMGWKNAKKKIKPQPSSLLQGVLNELREYLSLDQILAIHPLISKVGPSYVWVPNDIATEDEERIVQKISQTLGKMYGPGMYETLEADVKKSFR